MDLIAQIAAPIERYCIQLYSCGICKYAKVNNDNVSLCCRVQLHQKTRLQIFMGTEAEPQCGRKLNFWIRIEKTIDVAKSCNQNKNFQNYTSLMTSLINLTRFDLCPFRCDGLDRLGSLVTLWPFSRPTHISIEGAI